MSSDIGPAKDRLLLADQTFGLTDLSAQTAHSIAPAPITWWDWALIAFGVLLTVGTAIFVAAEFSLVALDPASVDRRAQAGDRAARGVSRALQQLSAQLSGAQVGITLTTILLGYTTQTSLVKIFSHLMSDLAGQALATSIAVAVSLILVNAFSMVFGELIPKNLALAKPLAVAGRVTPLQLGFTTLFKPVIWVLNTMANRVIRVFGVEPLEEASSARSASELAALVRYSAEEGTFDPHTATLFTKSVGLGRLCAQDVMTNRGRMATLPETASAEDVIDLARETGHSRFPVIGEDSDDVVGIVHLRRAVAVPYERRHLVPVTSQSLLTAAPRVPETVKLAPLLVELRETGLQMAVVVDEYGGTSGLVTLEDVVEEIVGEVADEHDFRRRGIRSLGTDSWLIDGTLRPDEINDRINIRLPDDGPYETLAGLVLSELGRMAQVGDVIFLGLAPVDAETSSNLGIGRGRGETGMKDNLGALPLDASGCPLRLEVKRLENRRIAQVQVSKVSEFGAVKQLSQGQGE